MSWGLKVSCTYTMIGVTVLGMMANHFLMVWACMELVLMVFCLYLAFESWAWSVKTSTLFFILQSLSGLILLIFMLTTQKSDFSALGVAFFQGVMLLKMGGFPAHQWVLFLGEKMGWLSLYLLLVLQKVLPLNLFKNFITTTMLILITLSWLFVASLGLTLTSLKKILIISSVFALMSLIYLLTPSDWSWKMALVLYGMSLAPIMAGEGSNKENSRSMGRPQALSSMIWMMAFLSLSGVPPLPGFFFKVEVLNSLLLASGMVFSTMMFVLGSLLFVYIYLGVMMQAMLKSNSMAAMSNTYYFNFQALILFVSAVFLLI